MRYEKSHILHNLALQLVIAALVFGALMLVDYSKPELAGILEGSQSSSISIAHN